ncbi:MAG: hypothetical protein P8N63_05800 [Pseudomonadales bacterium]|nr:hypothetical protein [Pseudomonadales bacterium]
MKSVILVEAFIRASSPHQRDAAGTLNWFWRDAVRGLFRARMGLKQCVIYGTNHWTAEMR